MNSRLFFTTFITYQRAPLFRNPDRAHLLTDVLHECIAKSRFELSAHVIMPDHIHALVAPAPDVSVEKAVQFIKGGFSFRLKREHQWKGEVWQQSFTSHRIRDEADLQNHITYIHQNPVRARLTPIASEYPFSSAYQPRK